MSRKERRLEADGIYLICAFCRVFSKVLQNPLHTDAEAVNREVMGIGGVMHVTLPTSYMELYKFNNHSISCIES